MTTKDDKAPVRADDDEAELAAIAADVRPVVDAGKGRALAFEVVRAMLMIFAVRDTGPLFAPSFSTWFERALFALNEWLCRALDVDTGREQERHPADRLTLLAIAGVADRIASQAWCLARTGAPVPLERWIVHDLATTLRRACGCFGYSRKATIAAMLHDGDDTVRAIVKAGVDDTRSLIRAAEAIGMTLTTTAEDAAWTILQAMPHEAKDEFRHTADTLLPLLIRDARRLCLAAKVDVGPIEAAIARHGGRPS